MALTLRCDGKDCAEDLPVDTKAVGRIEKKYFCAGCLAVYDAADDEIEQARLELTLTFSGKRAEILAKARATLGALPDE